MSIIKLIGAAALASAALCLSAVGPAQASQWGCEVLLCASSSNPSWRSVPACHPPMHRLISAMRRTGFSWPTCPEAGAGKPGYEKYAECPAGWRVGYSEYGRGGPQEPDLCTQVTDTCRGRFTSFDDCRQIVSMPRLLRDAPYYFDVRSGDGVTTRHWFNLRK